MNLSLFFKPLKLIAGNTAKLFAFEHNTPLGAELNQINVFLKHKKAVNH